MENKLFKPIMIDSQAKERLKYIAQVSGKKQATLLSELIDSLAHVYVNFDKASFVVDYSPISNIVEISVYVTKRKGALSFGKATSEQELINIIDKETRA